MHILAFGKLPIAQQEESINQILMVFCVSHVTAKNYSQFSKKHKASTTGQPPIISIAFQ